jgi:hypothetical protein
MESQAVVGDLGDDERVGDLLSIQEQAAGKTVRIGPEQGTELKLREAHD